MNIFVMFLLVILLTKFNLPLVLNFLKTNRLKTKNYRGELIPSGYGLILGLNLIIILIVGTLLAIYEPESSMRFIILILTMTLIGFIDDTLGEKEFKGFKGHCKAFFYQSRLTTGFLKMFFSFVIIFYLFFYWYFNLVAALRAAFIVLLSANLINLLDLRPGRALKAFLFLASLILVFKGELLFLGPSFIMALFFLPIDLKAKAMLGDVGANVLGAVLGMSFMLNSTIIEQVIILFVLISINLYAELYSLTTLISKNKLLNFVDKLGRT